MCYRVKTGVRLFALSCVMMLVAGCTALSPPLSEPQVSVFADRLGATLVEQSEPFAGVLTIEIAVDRAVRLNQAARVKELEVALADAKVRAQSGSFLPNIVAESDYYRRDRTAFSRSSQSNSYSSSSDTHSLSRSISISWNILDLGLSYIRTRQGLDKAYQQREEARRVAARISEETTSAYWRAVAAQTLEPALAKLDGEITSVLKLSRAASHDAQLDPTTAINFQRDMLNAVREVTQVQASLAGATDQLKQSISLVSPAPLRLEHHRPPTQALQTTADDDVSRALRHRPEIRQHMYDLRITDDEVHATILQLLPGATLTQTMATDSTSYLLHHNWISWGTKVAGNLINAIRLPADLDAVDAQAEVHKANALATATMIAMQVHVARVRISVLLKAYGDANRLEAAQRKLLQQVQAAVTSGKVAPQLLTREKLAMLLAETRSVLAFGELQAAIAAYATARGDTVGPVPHQIVLTHGAPMHKTIFVVD